MLIDFSVTNYRSILARQTLSMVASPYFKEWALQNTAVPDSAAVTATTPRLLRSTVLYGPNASGKSTLIAALWFVKKQVLNSQKEGQKGEAIDVQPFKLSAASRAADSIFEINFVEQGVRYEYGFCANAKRFTEEWLFAFPQGRAQKWFHRVFDAETGEDKYKFSSSFLGGRMRQSWAAQTRPNALFFSAAIQLNNTQLEPAFDWFRSRLQVVHTTNDLNSLYTLMWCDRREENRRLIVEFMNAADLSLADIRLKKAPISLKNLPFEMSGPEIEMFIKSFPEGTPIAPRFFHKAVDTQELIEFAEEEESAGTRTLFALAGAWLDVLDNNMIFVADELDTSLHPLMMQHLVKQFHQAGGKAQLIFTTHDTSLLSQKFLRRDQVWFIEKNAESASQLYPLSDFSPREHEAVERAYLNGRYGGIPFLKDLDFNGV